MESYFNSTLLNNRQRELSHIENISANYIRKTDFIRQNHAYVVDKMPNNYLYLGFLQKDTSKL